MSCANPRRDKPWGVPEFSDRDKRILAELNAGRAGVDIAREHGVTPKSIYRIRERAADARAFAVARRG